MEDNFAVFEKVGNGGAPTIVAKDTLNLAAKFAVTGAGPGGITRMVTNGALPSNLPGIKVSMTHTNPDAVKVARALKEMVKPADPTPKADAGDGYMSFTGGTAQSPRLLRIARDSDGGRHAWNPGRPGCSRCRPTTRNPLILTTGSSRWKGLTPSPKQRWNHRTHGGLADASATAGSAATFSGEFSFLKTLALTLALDNGDNGDDCAVNLTELRKPSEDDRTVLTDETTPRRVGEFADKMALCVEVDGETAIPKTGAYTVTTEYKGPA